MFKKSLIALTVVCGSLAQADVQNAPLVQSPQPHPLPFSDITQYDGDVVCVRRQEAGAPVTCYETSRNFQGRLVKHEGQLVLGPDPGSFQQFIAKLKSTDNNEKQILRFLEGTLAICKDYRVQRLFVNQENYALEIEFIVDGAYRPHRLFVLGTIKRQANGSYRLTYDGLADYTQSSSGIFAWHEKFGLPFNSKSQDLPKFMKRGAGFAGVYTLDYILSQEILNPAPH